MSKAEQFSFRHECSHPASSDRLLKTHNYIRERAFYFCHQLISRIYIRILSAVPALKLSKRSLVAKITARVSSQTQLQDHAPLHILSNFCTTLHRLYTPAGASLACFGPTAHINFVILLLCPPYMCSHINSTASCPEWDSTKPITNLLVR